MIPVKPQPVQKQQPVHDNNDAVVVQSILLLNVLGILCLCVAMPVMSWGAGTFYGTNGEFLLISDGFRMHSALATVMYGTCSLSIGTVRLLVIALFVQSELLVCIEILVLVACQIGGMMTVRVDVLQDAFHWTAASLWIITNLLFQFLVVFQRQEAWTGLRQSLAACILVVASICGFIYATIMIAERDGPGTRGRAFAFEFLCAWGILANDLIMTEWVGTTLKSWSA